MEKHAVFPLQQQFGCGECSGNVGKGSQGMSVLSTGKPTIVRNKDNTKPRCL